VDVPAVATVPRLHGIRSRNGAAAAAAREKTKEWSEKARPGGRPQRSSPEDEQHPRRGMHVQGAGHFCSWCGKAEETEEMKRCPRCKNIEYCSSACQEAGWREHKLVCGELKRIEKAAKKNVNSRE